MHARVLTTVVKEANGDSQSPSVRAAVERAKKDSMPAENIERALKKGQGVDATSYRAVRFEAFGPGGAALIIDGLTDNNNRTSQEVKHIFTKLGLTLGAPGCAAWAFIKGKDGWEAQTPVELRDDDLDKLEKLVDALEEHEDIESVFTNVA